MSNDLQESALPPGPAALRASRDEPGEACGAADPSPDAVCDAGVLTTPSLDPLQMRAWTAFLRAHARIVRRLEADLVATADMPLAEYDVLVQLAAAPEQRLRMHELADRVVLSRAGVTRLVDRLVADGLVERAKCGADARGSFAVLTDLGRRRLGEAAPGHLAAVKRYFVGRFDRAELAALANLLEREVGS